MFSKEIVLSDAFFDLPKTSQLLYFFLWMEADDDWFLWSPKRILRSIWGNDDDLKILIYRRFLIEFESWVVVIKHRGMNNFIRKDRYKKTTYTKEMSKLKFKENGSYTEVSKSGQPLVNQTVTTWQPVGQPSIGKDSIDKNRLEEISIEVPKGTTAALKKQPREDISNLCSLLRSTAEQIWLAYDLDRERQFVKHILDAKEFSQFCEKVWYSNDEFACRIMRASASLQYVKTCNWPRKIYKHYHEVYNEFIAKKWQQKQSQNKVLVV